ncbi:MAG: hypothetical protein N3D11_03405 [Candidatus Sumerlaeia bacterium]|nr:hypothetical protein [Candidatus Sumerlaeia bacterium]
MKRLVALSLLLTAAVSCSRSGKPLVAETVVGVGREFFDPHYFRDTPLAWKVIWFIGPGH